MPAFSMVLILASLWPAAVTGLAAAPSDGSPSTNQRSASSQEDCPALPKEEIRIRPGEVLNIPIDFDSVSIFDRDQNKDLLFFTRSAEGWSSSVENFDQAFQLKKGSKPERLMLRMARSATPARNCYQPFRVPNPGVTSVRCISTSCAGSPRSGGLGQEIQIDVADLDVWIDDLKKENKLPRDAGVKDLVPFIDGHPLNGITPENPEAQVDKASYSGEQLRWSLTFVLKYGDANKGSWTRLLTNPSSLMRRVSVAVGFPDGDPIYTWVTPTATDEYYQFSLVLIPRIWGLVALGVLLAALILFLYLMARTDIVRDPSAPLLPDGASPWSLARLQMAFWFFLVIVSYTLLFLLLNATDTITGSVLTLIGISAVTALGATVIDAGKFSQRERYQDVLADSSGKIPADALVGVQMALDAELKILRQLRAAAADDAAQEQSAERVRGLQRQRRFLTQRPWQNFVYNVLGDDGAISFHRFQIAVWTLVLGLIFVKNLVYTLAMRDFSTTELGLMGISAGTYIGFKLPTTGGGNQ